MNFKPKARAGYGNQQLDHVLQTCLYMATKLGDLLGEIVVVGGLVPYLLIDQEKPAVGLATSCGYGRSGSWVGIIHFE